MHRLQHRELELEVHQQQELLEQLQRLVLVLLRQRELRRLRS